MKYSFLLPYFNRKKQFEKTLHSYLKFYANRDDWELCVVVDEKTDPEEVVWVYECLNGLECKFDTMANDGFSPVKLYNKAFEISEGNYVIVTNPECMHETNVLTCFDAVLRNNSNSYVVAACLFQQKNGRMVWRQHSKFCSTKLHFCSVLSRANYEKIGGFDEEFHNGYCFDDDAFRDAMILNSITTIECDEAIVFHQYHNKVRPANHDELWYRNKNIWIRKYAEPLGIEFKEEEH